jgi:hypothetical protein
MCKSSAAQSTMPLRFVGLGPTKPMAQNRMGGDRAQKAPACNPVSPLGALRRWKARRRVFNVQRPGRQRHGARLGPFLQRAESNFSSANKNFDSRVKIAVCQMPRSQMAIWLAAIASLHLFVVSGIVRAETEAVCSSYAGESTDVTPCHLLGAQPGVRVDLTPRILWCAREQSATDFWAPLQGPTTGSAGTSERFFCGLRTRRACRNYSFS